MLWIGTNGGGLDRLDPARGIFTHYRHQAGLESSLSNDTVPSIYQDRGGTLWLGTNGGLDRFEPSNGAFVQYRHDQRDPASLINDDVSFLYEDSCANF